MKITPLDIQQQQFKGKMLGGLDPDDVDAFLQMVSGEMEELIRENTGLKEQLHKNARNLDELNEREIKLRETMLAAQKVTEEMKANAEREAKLIVSEAELKAEKILAESNNRLVQLNTQIQELRLQKMQFESAFRSLLETHSKLLTASGE